MAQIILDSANNLIQGDFDTATLALRTRMQTSTTNATTGVYVVPNGSATSASVQVSNAADPTNASKVVVATNGTTDTQIISGVNGSGSYLPLSFYTNNDIRFQMGNAGELNVRTAPGTVSAGTSGQFLTSGGPGAGVSWTTAAAGGFSNMDVFTASGPGTFTTPATTTKIKVTVIAGGGGSGGSINGVVSGGGGGGGSSIRIFSVASNTGYSYTVGAAGTAGSAPGAGGTGGTSSFGPVGGTTISATGGGGGGGPGGASGGPGGAGSNGNINFNGTPGFTTIPLISGGGSIIGSSFNAQSYGGGGRSVSFGPPGSGSGNAGFAGLVIVEY
jgi:hypothetical protein